jgi:hypothetical protein
VWSLSALNVLLSVVFCLQWWFTKGCPSTSATEPITFPSPRPPPAWASPSTPSRYHSISSVTLSQRLQWWFIKGRDISSAAEPRLASSPCPPPSWGSVQRYLRSLLLLTLTSPVSASSLSSHAPTARIAIMLLLLAALPFVIVSTCKPVSTSPPTNDVQPFRGTILLVCLTSPIVAFLHCKEYIKRRWSKYYDSFVGLFDDLGPTTALLWFIVYPALAIGWIWWILTVNSILQLSLLLPFFEAAFACCVIIWITQWLPRFAIRLFQPSIRTVLSSARTIIAATISHVTQILPATRPSQSDITDQAEFTSRFPSYSLAPFLRWCFIQSFICILLVQWTEFIS